MFKKILKSVDNLFNLSHGSKKDAKKTTMNSQKIKVLEQEHISRNALETIKGLRKAGYDAYLVGGCIRDLLLSIRPKDFDVATSATPEQTRKAFRNSRVIGRRFKLVHVFWGRETIEVATFRGPHDKESISTESAHNSSGRILRDNVYGTIEEDVTRRDFTINALYYDVGARRVLDFVNGLQDIENRFIRLIGDPEQRYKEDPVRMLRAVRFAAKLDFVIEPKTEAPLHKLSPLLADIPAARLFDEILKLFLSGKALKTFELLRQYNLFTYLFPMTATVLAADPYAEKFIRQALTNTDERLNQGKTVNPAFLYATFLWPVLVSQLNAPLSEKLPDLLVLQQQANDLIAKQSQHTTIPKRFGIPMREIWEAQVRLVKRQGKKVDTLLAHPRFRAAYDFLLLRESVGENTNQLGVWWTDYQRADEIARRNMIRQLNGSKSSKGRRYHKPKLAKKAEGKVID